MSSQNYNLNSLTGGQPKSKTLPALRKLVGLLPEQRGKLILAFVTMVIYAILSMVPPVLIGFTINKVLLHKAAATSLDIFGWHVLQGSGYGLVLTVCACLLVIYLVNLAAVYLRTIFMGGFGQHLLFTLRNAIFNKLQELPVAFFARNKAGDLISRINNDTDKLNQFFSQSLMQFVSSIFILTGAGIALVWLNWRLGLATLAPAALMWIYTKLLSPWVKKKNAVALKATGAMSAEIQESLGNFKVVVAFNRRDYFRQRFDAANKHNYSSAIKAGIANNIFTPVYGLLASMGQMIVLLYGVYLVSTGHLEVGFLVSFILYVSYFYDPLRQLAALWASFQVAIAGWDRISQILSLESDLVTLPVTAAASGNGISGNGSTVVLEFKDVSFRYDGSKDVLRHNSFHMEKGKTYALVGPTGGGKTTTASLIARLYDPTEGVVLLNGRDIRTYTPRERAQKIGFILQEPFLFTGTVRDNILYGNEEYKDYTNEQLEEALHRAGLETLLARFDEGLDTKVLAAGDSISLGQKQLIAFIRAVLRNPELLILDEATANIDTVTEKMLEDILRRLPATTTRVIIAHRLNTIENADEIFFVNSGDITRAGSLDQAVNMLLEGKRVS
ncbi:putative ABC transporter ATP-binding protein [Puia dinghuensis]|uniref:Putative ABC transporter ATP-binding protein n=2 Tax=Puia dinghuensis TaxID=1792502 RepID=A0A8J2XQ83_9BACT|nr:putative ABC transporter ATP-binding protein [Puia dinghuensis]